MDTPRAREPVREANQLVLFAYATSAGGRVSYDWTIKNPNRVLDSYLASGMGRDHRDEVTGTWVAIGTAIKWLSESGGHPDRVIIVTRHECCEEPTYDLHYKMRARIRELADRVGCELVYETGTPNELHMMRVMAKQAGDAMLQAERKARAEADEREPQQFELHQVYHDQAKEAGRLSAGLNNGDSDGEDGN